MKLTSGIPLFEEFWEIHSALGIRYESDFKEINLFDYEDAKNCSDVIEPYRTNFYQVFFIYDSNLNGTYNDTQIRFVAEHTYLFFACPGKLISWQKFGDLHGRIFSFKSSFLLPFTSVSLFLRKFNFFNPEVNAPIVLTNPSEIVLFKDIFIKMQMELRSKRLESTEILFYYLQILLTNVNGLISSRLVERATNTKSAKRNGLLLKDFEALVRKSFPVRESIKTYAGVLHVTPQYLSEALKKESGKTARQIIQDILVLEARSLLLQTDLSITEISYRLGFSDPSHFVKLFRTKTGQTPVTYRKN